MIYITRGTRGKLKFRFVAADGEGAQPPEANVWLVHNKHGPVEEMPLALEDEGDGVWSLAVDSRGWHPGIIWGHARSEGVDGIGKDFKVMCIANPAHAHIPAPE
jgi:hypothetical protein